MSVATEPRPKGLQSFCYLFGGFLEFEIGCLSLFPLAVFLGSHFWVVGSSGLVQPVPQLSDFFVGFADSEPVGKPFLLRVVGELDEAQTADA